MKVMSTKSLKILATALMVSASLLHGAIIDVTPGNNNVPISQVTLDDNGTTIVQTTEATGAPYKRNTPVEVVSVVAGGVNLDVFNLGGAEIELQGFDTSNSNGVGVLNCDGTQIPLKDNKENYRLALENTLQNGCLNNYFYYDGTSSMPPAGTPDFDIHFRFAFTTDDKILVSERYGNTYFELTPLDVNGDPIPGANMLRFGYPNGAAYSKYDWNTGYANSSYQSDQAYTLTVASISKFFEGTTVPAADQNVFGFRIDNNGDADVKFFGLSDDTFRNNPINPDIDGDPPIAVTLTSFYASLYNGDVKIKWVSETEINHAGYNLYRSYSKKGTYAKINASLITQSHGVEPGRYEYIDDSISSLEVYYLLEDVSLDGQTAKHGPVLASVASSVAHSLEPHTFSLEQNYPNPFNPQTTIEFNLPSDEFVTLEIYDIHGNMVRRLVQSTQSAGLHSVVWDAIDEYENLVSTGLYIYRITAGDFSMSRQMTFMK